MIYQALAELLEEHKEEVVRWIVEETLARNVPGYAAIGHDSMVRGFTATIEMMGRYFRTNDVREWRDYLTRAAEGRRQQGLSTDSVFQMAELMGSKAKELIARELPGPANADTREKYFARIDSLANLSRATILKANLMKD